MNIIIIGLGLIGGSIAKELSEIKGINILAFDKNYQSIENALVNKTINGFIGNLDELTVDKYNDSLVLIATPPRASLEILRALSSLFNSCSTSFAFLSSSNAPSKRASKPINSSLSDESSWMCKALCGALFPFFLSNKKKKHFRFLLLKNSFHRNP